MPPLTQFIDGTGPVFAGKLFPFAFITIACGAISGFHALISSGTTPKLLEREPDARMIGYGAMLLESIVAMMALIAACVLTPGVYFAINAPAGSHRHDGAECGRGDPELGIRARPAELETLARNVGEASLLSRTGGAPSLAVGMAHIFSSVLGGSTAMAIWYHFAIMFEALFILTTLDAGTRVGRFMLQDLGKHVWKPFGRVSWYPAVVLSSAIFVAMWGYFLYQGVDRPVRRHQLAVAAVRHREPAAGGGGAVRRHDGHHQDGQAAIRLGDDAAADVARHRDDDGGLHEDLLVRPEARLPVAREPVLAGDRGRGASAGRQDDCRRDAHHLERPRGRDGRGVLRDLGAGDSRRVGARVAVGAAGQQAGGVD